MSAETAVLCEMCLVMWAAMKDREMRPEESRFSNSSQKELPCGWVVVFFFVVKNNLFWADRAGSRLSPSPGLEE